MTLFSRKKIISQKGVDLTPIDTRVTNLENNEYKITYYEVISGTSGSITIPTGATINAGEFGLSGNAILSKIDGSNKPTFESPKTSGGVIVTASLTTSTGAWVTSGTYTDSNVALIYSIKIKAVYYGNLTFNNIIETADITDGYVKKGTLTANTIPKATASDTIGNSQITDDGTNVGIVGNIQIGGVADARLYIKNANGNYYIAVENGGGGSIFYINPNGRISIGTLQDTYKLKVDGSFASGTIVDDGANVGINTLPSEKLHVNGNIRCDNLTASQIVETDASKNLVSVAKGTAYNKNFGTTAGTVLEGDRITQTITNGVTDKAPSEDAVFDALALKLTAANNLSDLANPLTARNNLKIWDLRITTGNQSTTSNVATNITDLVSHTLTANKLYDFEGHIYASCNNTGGVKFQITIPTGATIAACFDGSIGSNATFQSSIVLASATLTGFNFIQFNGGNIIKVKGQVLLGGTAGTIQFGFASGTNTQTSTINQLGTHITLRQLD